MYGVTASLNYNYRNNYFHTLFSPFTTVDKFRLCEIIKIMVTLSIVFSYGLQFCVPSEIIWAQLEPWLRKRRLNAKYSTSMNHKGISTISKSCITDSITTMTTAISTKTLDEKKLPDGENELLEEPVDLMYYVMRAIMIIGTCTVPHFFKFIFMIMFDIFYV